MRRIKNRGFTLIELMVVIVIIGILAALAIPKFLGASSKAKATECKPVLKQIFTLEEAYAQEKDLYSKDLAQLGFDAPAGTSRFAYTVSSVTANTNFVADAKVTTDIKDNAGKSVLNDVANIREDGVITATSDGLAGLLSVAKK
jgi:prepilin-type N-terminal cleavage/methylation domain-containing protein